MQYQHACYTGSNTMLYRFVFVISIIIIITIENRYNIIAVFNMRICQPSVDLIGGHPSICTHSLTTLLALISEVTRMTLNAKNINFK